MTLHQQKIRAENQRVVDSPEEAISGLMGRWQVVVGLNIS